MSKKSTMNCVAKSISPCIETIKVVDGQVMHLVWHQMRFDKTRKELFNATSPLWLSSVLKPPITGVYRIRITYADTILNVEYLPYVMQDKKHFALIENTPEYNYKYANREAINRRISSEVDDVIFVHEGLLMDTSIANIALMIEHTWLTPKTPLLSGTTRARLLASGFLKEAFLDVASLQSASKFAIMNALIGFKIIENQVIKGL